MRHKYDSSHTLRSCCGRRAPSTAPTTTPHASFSVRSRRLSRRRPASRRDAARQGRWTVHGGYRAAAVFGAGRRFTTVLARTGTRPLPTTPNRAGRYADVPARLRKSLVWARFAVRPGRCVRVESRISCTFGTNVFYSRFAQTGTKRQRATPLIHIDEAQHSEQLTTWLRDRASVWNWRSHDTIHEAAIKRYTDAGGTWPPSIKHVPRWPGSGRYAPMPVHRVRPSGACR